MDYTHGSIVSKDRGEEDINVKDVKTIRVGENVNNAKRSLELSELNQVTTTKIPRITCADEIDYEPLNRRPKSHVERIRDYCEDHKIFHEHEWRTAVQTSKEAAEIHRSLSMRGNCRKIIGSAVENARLIVPRKSYKERVMGLDHVKVDAKEYDKAMHDFTRIILHNRIDMRKVFQCLYGELGKRRTLYLFGAANSGKSSLLNMLSSVYRSHEIGRIGAQDIQSNFWLQDLIDKELYVGDEILVSQVNVDTVKLLCEGSKNLCTEIKYGNKQLLPARPVMIANNIPMCNNIQGHASAIRARCVEYQFTEPPGGLGNMTQNENVMRNVLATLYGIFGTPAVAEEIKKE